MLWGSTAVLASQPLLDKLPAEVEQCQDLCWKKRKKRDPLAQEQLGWISPRGCPGAGRTEDRVLTLGRDVGTSMFNQIIPLFK